MLDKDAKGLAVALKRSLAHARGMAIEALIEKLIEKAGEIADEEPEEIETADVVDLVEIGLAVIYMKSDQGLPDLFARMLGVDQTEIVEGMNAAAKEIIADAT